MLDYDKVDVSEGIDTDETDGLCECIIWHYWYLLDINVRFHITQKSAFQWFCNCYCKNT